MLAAYHPAKVAAMAQEGGSNGAEGSSAARGRWNALAENSRQRRPKGVEGTVRFRTSFHNVVYDVFRARAWKETDSDVDWDVCWADTGAPRKYRTCHCARASHVHLVPCTARRTAQIIRRTSCRSAVQARATYHLRSPPARAGWIRENFDTMRFAEHQRINHFRNHYELTRKASVIKNLTLALGRTLALVLTLALVRTLTLAPTLTLTLTLTPTRTA